MKNTTILFLFSFFFFAIIKKIGGGDALKTISLKNIENDIVFGNIYGLDQNWSEKEYSYSFIGTPRSDHGFMYVLCNRIHVVYKDKSEIDFLKGDLLYIPKYCEYYIEFLDGQQGNYDILVNFDIRNTSGEEFKLADRITCLTNDVPPKIIQTMRDIADISTNLKHPNIRVSNLFYKLLDKLVNRISLPEMLNEDNVPVFPAVYYLDNHVRDNISIPELARMCLLSESTFRKAFKAYTGMSPIQYRTYIKICKAQQLLRSTTEISIQEIAESLGFFDNTYFYKMFTKFTGLTPKQYRNQFTKKNAE